MKTTTLGSWTVLGLAALTATGAAVSRADEITTAAKAEKSCTGKVAAVDSTDRMLHVKGFLWSRKFNLGENCSYALLDKSAGGPAGLRSGQKVTIQYQDAHGVLVANRVTQQPMRFVGTVKSINAEQSALTIRGDVLGRTFEVAKDCAVVLHGGKTGALSNVQPGQRVTVTYETPSGQPTARQIAQTSQSYTGTLTALDQSERTIKTKSLLGHKKFNLADGCAFVLDGNTGARMRDFKLGETITISYDEVNGVNVANRIAGPAATPEAQTAQAAR